MNPSDLKDQPNSGKVRKHGSSITPINSMFPTFQDKLFETFKIFWKAGYSYSQTNNNADFYPKVLEKFTEEDLEEFLKRYQ